MFVPVVLGVLCGMRRGEIAALRWRCVDLDAGPAGGGREHRADRGGRPGEGDQGGKGRTVALPALVMGELRAHRLQQAEALLRFGVRLDDDHHVVARRTASRCSRAAHPCLRAVHPPA